MGRDRRTSRSRHVAHASSRRCAARAGTSFVTDFVYRVGVFAHGFGLTRERVTPPLRKRYDVVGSSNEAAWDVVVLASYDGRLVGFAATTFSAWNRRQILDELHVTAQRRRGGIGRMLVGEVERIAARNDAREIRVETQNVNAPAIDAYRRLGFQLTGIDVSRYPPPYENEVGIFLSRTLGKESAS